METIILDSVDKYNRLYGLETLHPLVSVVDLSKATDGIGQATIHYGLYALFLKDGRCCDIMYGRQKYDYQQGTIVSFAPGQVVQVNPSDGALISPKVYGLIFHPDLIRGTALGRNIGNYRFFSYSSFEALHLSQREREVVMDCLNKIQMELEHSIDNHSKQLISMNMELLLGYCMRFYERQFITRSNDDGDVLVRFEQLVNDYFTNGLGREGGLPSVKYFADKVHLSPNYFGDLVKKQSGKSPQEYIQYKLLDVVKERIMDSTLTISEIAYDLGFQYPQHLSRLFKRSVGQTPNEYRKMMA